MEISRRWLLSGAPNIECLGGVPCKAAMGPPFTAEECIAFRQNGLYGKDCTHGGFCLEAGMNRSGNTGITRLL